MFSVPTLCQIPYTQDLMFSSKFLNKFLFGNSHKLTDNLQVQFFSLNHCTGNPITSKFSCVAFSIQKDILPHNHNIIIKISRLRSLPSFDLETKNALWAIIRHEGLNKKARLALVLKSLKHLGL